MIEIERDSLVFARKNSGGKQILRVAKFRTKPTCRPSHKAAQHLAHALVVSVTGGNLGTRMRFRNPLQAPASLPAPPPNSLAFRIRFPSTKISGTWYNCTCIREFCNAARSFFAEL